MAANVVYSLLGVLSLASMELANTLAVGSFVGLMVTNSTILGAAATSVAKTSGTGSGAQASPAVGSVVGGVSGP